MACDRSRPRRAVSAPSSAVSHGAPLAHQADRGDRRRAAKGARRARPEGVRELERAGLVEARRVFGRLRLADRPRAGRRFDELLRRVRDDELTDSRDKELLLLLAASGVLAHRLSGEDRRLAARRLRTLGRPPTDRDALLPSAHRARMSPAIAALAAGYAGRAIGAEGFGLVYGDSDGDYATGDSGGDYLAGGMEGGHY